MINQNGVFGRSHPEASQPHFSMPMILTLKKRGGRLMHALVFVVIHTKPKAWAYQNRL